MKYTILFLSLWLSIIGKAQHVDSTNNKNVPIKRKTKMKVEIWSDVMCPFCYIGKRKFEAALSKFEHKDKIEIEWKSFELNPYLKTDTSISIYQYLAYNKGWSVDYAKDVSAQVTDMAKDVGLTYNFDKSIVANSFDAHRFSHLAKSLGKQDQAEELLFYAYFTEGKNISDHEVLIQLGLQLGIDAAVVKAMLSSNQFADNVKADELEAQKIGARGVPFFVMDRKYAVSGAQDPKAFLQTIEKAFKDWVKENSSSGLIIKDGAVCTPDGVCK